jgi:hypothetical protein
MTTLMIAMDDEKMQQLQQAASQLGIPVEEVIGRSVDEYLARRQRVQSAADYVLQKNAELYQRLAQ